MKDNPIYREAIHILDTTAISCYHINVRQGKSMPSKEVGHDTQRGLVVPVGVSSSELSGSVGRRWLG